MSAIYLVDTFGSLKGPVALLVIPGVGLQVPDNSIELSQVLPDCASGFAWGMVNGEPVELEDHRGTVYSTLSGGAQEWYSLGPLPQEFTSMPCPGPFHVWRKNAWHLDEDAKSEAKVMELLKERDSRLQDAQVRIAPLQYAHEVDQPTEQEQEFLVQWKRYSVELNRIEQQAGFPLEINWPIPPSDDASISGAK